MKLKINNNNNDDDDDDDDDDEVDGNDRAEEEEKEVNSDGSVKKGRRDGKALYIIQRTISSLGISSKRNRHSSIEKQKEMKSEKLKDKYADENKYIGKSSN
jgi:hypothetical protein